MLRSDFCLAHPITCNTDYYIYIVRFVWKHQFRRWVIVKFPIRCKTNLRLYLMYCPSNWVYLDRLKSFLTYCTWRYAKPLLSGCQAGECHNLIFLLVHQLVNSWLVNGGPSVTNKCGIPNTPLIASKCCMISLLYYAVSIQLILSSYLPTAKIHFPQYQSNQDVPFL